NRTPRHRAGSLQASPDQPIGSSPTWYEATSDAAPRRRLVPGQWHARGGAGVSHGSRAVGRRSFHVIGVMDGIPSRRHACLYWPYGPLRCGQEPDRSPRLGRLLMIFPTATTRNSCPVTASSIANVCPGLAAGTRFPYPTVVIVTKLKNRSWLSEPGPAGPKNGTVPNSPAAL